jgi:hypothetical protein
MEINTDKTKSLVFNSTGRLFPVTFMIDNQLIEKFKQYRYLGVMFNASGSFSDAKEELYKRGLKAFYSTEILYPDCFVVLLQFQRGEQCHQQIINSLILEN